MNETSALLILQHKTKYPKIDENYRKFLIGLLKSKHSIFNEKENKNGGDVLDILNKRKTLSEVLKDK